MTMPKKTRAHARLRILSNECGSAVIEYAMLAAGIGAMVAASIWSLGNTTHNLYASIVALF